MAAPDRLGDPWPPSKLRLGTTTMTVELYAMLGLLLAVTAIGGLVAARRRSAKSAKDEALSNRHKLDDYPER